jgi:hypothetical protein
MSAKVPGAAQPDPEIYDALRAAAVAYSVPISLLEAVAAIESNFDPTAEGPVTGEGWRAKGLMQLSPKIIEKYGVLDPFDPRASAMGGAALLAALGRGTGWDEKRMLAAYVWGPVRLAAAERQGSVYPAEVASYVAKVQAARRFYQGIADVRGWAPADSAPDGSATPEGVLDVAWFDLATANPSWLPAQVGYQEWQEWYAKIPQPNHIELLAQWMKYAACFDRAPITDATTVAPWKIKPGVSMPTAKQLADSAARSIDHLGNEVRQGGAAVARKAKEVGGDIADGMRNLGEGALELGGGLLTAAALFGALYIVVSNRSNRS